MSDRAPAHLAPVPGPIQASIIPIIVVGGLVGAAGHLVGDRLAPGAGWAAWVAVGAIAVVFAVGLGVIRVWSPRPMDAWMRAYLGGQAVRFFAAIAAAGALLYSLPHSARGVGGVTFAVGYFATLMAESWATAGHFRRALAARPAPVAGSDS